MEIRHKTKMAAVDLFTEIVQGILNGDDTSVVEPKNAEGLLKINCYVEPSQVSILLGRQHIIKDSIVNILRVVCRHNDLEDIYIRFEERKKLEEKLKETTNA